VKEASKMDKVLLSLITTLPIGIGVVVAALSMRRISVSAVEGMTRQPEIAGQLFTAMLIGMALIEALCIYALVVSLMLAGNVGG
jgi:F-type H+-transporting ATPase subunit c